jgi:hypothetical protein
MPISKETVSRIRESLPGGVKRQAAAQDSHAHSPLHWMATGLFLTTGVEALAGRRVAAQVDGHRRQPWDALGMAPLVIAPLAGIAHAAVATRPAPRVRRMARVLDGLAISAAAAAVAAGAYAAAERSQDSRRYQRARYARLSFLDAVAPLAFGVTGVLGLLLDREERQDATERRRLAWRASLVERLVPRRKARLDRIVVHI